MVPYVGTLSGRAEEAQKRFHISAAAEKVNVRNKRFFSKSETESETATIKQKGKTAFEFEKGAPKSDFEEKAGCSLCTLHSQIARHPLMSVLDTFLPF